MKLADIKLSLQQRSIVCETTGNIVVSASAGTGKTRTMIARIVNDLSQNKTHRVIAAITFTIRAAQEIRDRLTIDSSQCFIGTNNSFAIEEVIKPFMKDVYGDDYDIDIDTDYSNTDLKLCKFSDGLQYVRDYRTIYSYCDNRKNFVFELALDIVKRSTACQLYLQAKYFAIYIDEYQDCDTDMHNFFMYLSDALLIMTFIVGDDKQSIYRWRGASPDSFKSVFVKQGFTHKELTENHRSDKQIQDYSNLFFDGTRRLIINPQNSGNILWVRATNEDWAIKIISLLDDTQSSALLRHAKKNTTNGKQGASEGAGLLTKSGIKHIYIPPTPIDDIATNTAWLYTAVASYVLLNSYSAYDFINDIPAESDAYTVGRIQRMLNSIQKNIENTDTANFSGSVKVLADYLGYMTTEQHIEKLYETATDDKYAVALNQEKPLHCTLTLHSSKGLEFEQVILFIEDYAHSGNVGLEHINNHYVACTRARTKLIIIDTNSSDAKAAKAKVIEMLRAANIQASQLISRGIT
jgi:superfamily I DNA/RNA helicase